MDQDLIILMIKLIFILMVFEFLMPNNKILYEQDKSLKEVSKTLVFTIL